jgi:hypothetical protein
MVTGTDSNSMERLPQRHKPRRLFCGRASQLCSSPSPCLSMLVQRHPTDNLNQQLRSLRKTLRRRHKNLSEGCRMNLDILTVVSPLLESSICSKMILNSQS